MRNSITLFIVLIIANLGFSQTVTVSKGVSLKSELAYDLLGNVGSNILLYRDRGNKHFVDVFDKEMAFSKNRELQFEQKKVEVQGLVVKDSSFNIMYSYKKGDNTIYSIRKYDGEVALIDSSELFRLPKSYKRRKFLVETSENEKFSILFQFDGSDKMEFYLIRHDSLDVLYKKILEVEDLDLRDRFRKIVLTDRGEILILLQFESGRFSSEDNHMSLFVLDDEDSFDYSRIDIDDMVVSDVEMKFDNINRKVCIVGLWHEKNKDAAKGYFYLNKPFVTLSAEEAVTLTSFSPEFLSEVTNKEIGKATELKDFELNQIVLRQDGGFVLFAESLREYSRRASYPASYNNSRGLSGWLDHIYEDVIVIAVHPEGKEHWKKVLFKKQFSQDDFGIFSSYFLMKTPSRLKLIFNDEIKNNNTVSEYILDPLGRFNRNSLLSTDYQNLKIRFADAVQISSNEFVAPSEKNRKLSLVKIAY